MTEPHIRIQGWERTRRRRWWRWIDPAGVAAGMFSGLIVGALAMTFHWSWLMSFILGLAAGAFSGLAVVFIRVTRR